MALAISSGGAWRPWLLIWRILPGWGITKLANPRSICIRVLLSGSASFESLADEKAFPVNELGLLESRSSRA
jgi:hypothetical protein